MKFTAPLLISCLIITVLGGQSMELTPGVTGYWKSNDHSLPITPWKAQWIWLDAIHPNSTIFARKSFSLSNIPTKALLQITASSQYQLFINGKYINSGPARTAPHHQSFDVLDITKILVKGKNVIAVRIHHQKGKYSYQQQNRAGLLAQLNLMDQDDLQSIPSDDSWKVIHDPAWDSNAPVISRFQMVVNDRMDLRASTKNWAQPLFDDTYWPNATPLKRIDGWPLPQKNSEPHTLTPPWTSLVPRDLPYLIENTRLATKLIEARTLSLSEINPNRVPGNDTISLTRMITPYVDKQIPSFLSGNGKLTFPPLDTTHAWFLLFDLGRVFNGVCQLDVQGMEGTVLDIISSPFIVDNKLTARVVDSDFLDRIILSGDNDRWEATYFKPTRYLGLIINAIEAPIEIKQIGLRHFDYPFERQGFIKSTDAPWVETFVEASAKTINVCTTDGYTDNYRERRQYAQTGYYAGLGNYWTFGDHYLQRRYLIQIAQEQMANGIMPAYAPLAKDDFMVILDSNCLWLRSLHNYFLYTGDTTAVTQLLPAAYKLLELLHSFTNEHGLIDNPPYPYWLDHARIDRRGANFCLNAHYLGALEDIAAVLRWLKIADHKTYQSRSALLQQSLKTLFWNNDQSLFMDAWINGSLSQQSSEHTIAMALATRIASEEQAAQLIKLLLERDDHNFITRASGLTMVTPAMSYFLHKGICNYGYIDDSFELLKSRFKHMLSGIHNNGTFWEEWWLTGSGRSGKFQGGKTRSDAQTESAFSPSLFGEFLLGVHPTKPGLKEITLTSPNTALKQLEGQLPTPQGKLMVHWELNQDSGRTLLLEIPEETLVNLDLQSLKLQPFEHFMVDDRLISYDPSKQVTIPLTKGKHQIKF